MKEKLRARDYRFIAICVALLAGTIWFSARNFYRAFPEASIDFRVSREEARAAAARFLASQGHKIDGYRQAGSFTFDDQTKTFLEREAGLEQANRIMGTRVRLWRWSYRWFRPQQKEEFRVDITPRGELIGFRHEIPEDAGRPSSPSAEAARALAEEFLRTRFGRDPAALDFVESSEAARPNRIDRVFTWKERDFDLHGAANRVEVTVLGGEVGGYREYLKIPEQWTRDYERLRSKNEAAQYFDTAVVVVLVLGMVVTIVLRVRRQDVRWRRATMVGAVGMLLAFGAQLNEFPLQEFGYPTTDSYGSFLARQLLNAVLAALGAGGLLFILTAGAEPLYRETCGGHISLGRLFRPRALGTRRFLLGSILGITLTGIFVAYQTGFYIVAYRFGAWSPADVPYSDLLNTRFPWLFVLFGGFLPAVSEEFLFRMFAIPFLRKMVRSLAVAVVLAGFIWGFGHAGYPQQPFYIRGLEVGIGGVALGWIMLRWGILPALVWHYSVDAVYSAMLLMRSESLYFRLSGAASAGILVLPVAIALIAYWRRGGFEPETGLLNADEAAAVEPPERAPEPAAATLEYRPLGVPMRLAALGILVLGLLSRLIPVSRFGESPGYRIPREQARSVAEKFLRAEAFDPGGFRHLTFPATHWDGDDSLAAKYFLERRPVSDAARLFELYRPAQHWVTRYFQSLDQEEAFVSVHPETGKVLGFNHTIPEDRPGADIASEAARQIATDFAVAAGWDLSAMELKESTSEKKKARRDHTLVWEARLGDPRNLDEAHYRVQIGVTGDRVASLRAYWKIPESYSRTRSQRNALSIGVLVMRIAVMAGLVVFALWVLIQSTRMGLVRWRATIRVAVPVTLLFAVNMALSVGLTVREYNTAIPFGTFQAVTYTGLAMGLIFGFLFLGGAAALVVSFYPESVTALRAASRRVLEVDAGAALLAAIGLGILLGQAQGLLRDRLHALALFSIVSPDLIVNPSPALAAITGAARSTLMNAGVVALGALAVARAPKRWMLVPIALAALCVNVSGDLHTPAEFALEYGLAFLAGCCVVVFCFGFARRNYLAYALVLWLMALRGPLSQLFGNGNRALDVQGWIVAGVLAATVAWAVLPAITGGRRGTPTTQV